MKLAALLSLGGPQPQKVSDPPEDPEDPDPPTGNAWQWNGPSYLITLTTPQSTFFRTMPTSFARAGVWISRHPIADPRPRIGITPLSNYIDVSPLWESITMPVGNIQVMEPDGWFA